MKRYLPLIALSATLLGGPAITTAASTAATDTAAHNNAFAADLYAQLNKSNAGKNLFLSPYSISAALAMTAQGARGTTADQMNKTLHIDTSFPAGMAEITQALNPKDTPPFELSVANALWVDQTFPLMPDFVDQSKTTYAANVVPVDFLHNAEPARKQINTAIAAQTHDKIRDLLPARSVDATTAIVLTNAIYFKGTWQTPFSKDATSDQRFHAPGGTDVTVPMMKSPRDTMVAYGETDDAQMVALSYKAARPSVPDGVFNGPVPAPTTLSMLIILPKKADALAAVEKQATPDNLAKWAKDMQRQQVNVFLPRFTMTTQFELSKDLESLGITDAFTSKADFTGISASAAHKLMISAVVHQAFIDVNEEGTEAAAATGVIMTRALARPPGQIIEFRADHPFLLLIRHDQTGSILFMGRVNNPKE